MQPTGSIEHPKHRYAKDGWTDGQTDTGQQHAPRSHSVAR